MSDGWGIAPPAVACVGLSCRDHVWRVERFPPAVSRTHAEGYRADGGGPAATAAVAAARLGARARLWAIHGDDDDGRANADELRAYGVDLAGCHAPPGARSFVSAVLVAPDGERFIFPYRGDGLADEPAFHDWAGLAGVGAVLVDGRHPRLAAHAVAWAAAHHVPSVGDWGDLRHPELRARIDHLIASEEAGREAGGAYAPVGPDAPVGADTAEDAVAAAVRAAVALRDRPEQLVAVTLGPLGVVWDDGRDVWRQAAPHVDVVESNGAGDAFHGAYAAAIAGGLAVADAVRLATAVGALRCAGEGRAALPDLPTAWALADRLPAPTHLGRSRAHPGGPA
ncbi:MAG: PfkB family carbohydrate kinase [Trueperaceae bacterium]